MIQTLNDINEYTQKKLNTLQTDNKRVAEAIESCRAKIKLALELVRYTHEATC